MISSQQGSEKGKEGKKDKKGRRKITKPEEDDSKKEGACNKCNAFGHFALNCPKKRESNNVSYSGGDDQHCSTFTDDQFQGITMQEKVGPVVEQLNITELMMDSGAACHVWPCRMIVGYSFEEAFLTTTGV